MNSAETIDVLIVGAGPTGLTLAYGLRRLGVDFRIVDKNPGSSTTSKAIGLQYRVSEVLTWMGLFDRFLARGVTGTGVSFYAGGEQILHLRLDGLRGVSGAGAFEPKSIVLPQSVTESLLIEALAEDGVEVERGTTFLGFEQDRDGVVSRLRRPDGGEETLDSRYLVGCEGPHSTIRKEAGFSFEGKTYPVSYFMADVELDWELGCGDVHVWIHEDGMFSAIPMPGARRWRLFVESGKEVEEGATEVTLDLVRRLMAERTGDRSTRATDPTWLSEFRISCRMVDRFGSGRVFLAGDAAHVHSPTGGQGIATGVQDAYNLAWKLDLVLKGAPASLLETYTEERLPVVRGVLKTTDQTAGIFLAHSPARRLFRDRIVLPLLRSRAMQSRLTRKMSQLDINYRGASLSVHQEKGLPRRTRIRAGDRTPDVLFRDAGTGEEATLFDRLGRSRPVALFGLDAGAAGDRPLRIRRLMEALGHLGVECSLVLPESAQRYDGEALIDVGGEFRRLYGARGEFLYFVRPDGYVGLFQRPVDEPALRAYAARFFGREAVEVAFAARKERVAVEARR